MNEWLTRGIEFNLWLEQFRTTSLDYSFLFFHYIGAVPGYMVLVPLSWVLWRRLAIPLTIAVLVSWGLNEAIKHWVALPRPFLMGETQPIVVPASFSFPSGHAQAAAVFWGFLLFKCKTWGQAMVPVLFISMIGLSRVYLGVHYFTDVLVGWALGMGVAYAAHRVSSHRR